MGEIIMQGKATPAMESTQLPMRNKRDFYAYELNDFLREYWKAKRGEPNGLDLNLK